MNVNININKKIALIVAGVVILLALVAGTSLAVTTAQNSHNLAVQRAAAAALHKRTVIANNKAAAAAKAKATAQAIARANARAAKAEKSAKKAARAAKAANNPAPPAVVVVPAAPAVPVITDPWAVVSAYYGDVESGDYASAYALLSSGMATGQSYQNFVNGYACTGSEYLTENWESGDQVNFDLVASDNCSGTTQYFTGTDTVQNGVIVAGNVVQTG